MDRIVLLTDEERPLWEHLGVPLEVIPNPCPWKPMEISPLSVPIVLAIGRLSVEKNMGEMVEIWRDVIPHAPEWRLRLVGSGYQQASIQARIRELGLEDSVELLPPTTDVKRIYREASMLILTSKTEGLPMVLIEGQTMGLPIISYACKTGPSSIVLDGHDGYLVPVGDRATFVDRLLRLIRDNELRRQMSAQAVVRAERYQVGEVIHQWTRLFQEYVQQ